MNSTAIINIAKAQLAMDEDDYRAMLTRVTGQNSLRAMTERQKLAVVDELKRLGFRVKSGGRTLPPSVKPYIRLIHALWKSCYQLGVIEDASRPALRAFCKRFVAHGQGSVAVDPDLLDYAQATPIIEALKKMEQRGRARRAG
jgi:phage gp16-like protein